MLRGGRGQSQGRPDRSRQGWQKGQRDDLTLSEAGHVFWERRALVAGCTLLLFALVPTGPVLPGSRAVAGSRRLVGAVRSFGEGRDVVLLDAPVAGEVLAAPDLWGSFDGVLLVVHAARTPKGVARGFTDALLDARMDLFGVVLNGHV